MRRLVQQFLKKEKGVAAVEFGLTAIIFVGVIFAFFDLAFLAVTSAELDYIVAISSKYSKNEVVSPNKIDASFNTYHQSAEKQARQLIKQIMNTSVILDMSLNNKVDVHVCRAKDYNTIIAQLKNMIAVSENQPTSSLVCLPVVSVKKYYPYAVYQYTVNYKPLLTIIPAFDRYEKQLMTRRYVALQEWIKDPD